MKTTLKLFTLTLLFSCSHAVKEIEAPNPATDTTKAVKKPVVIKDTVDSEPPSANFIELITYMDSCSYKVDSTSIAKNAKRFGNIPANKEYYTASFIHSLLSDTAVFEEGSMSLTSVTYSPKYDQTFAKAKYIWTYSWRIPDSEEGLKRRGTVEEWTFDNEQTAITAYDFLINEYKKLGFPFCKTAAFYLQCGNRLFMFHSNHSGVAYRHQKFHKWLQKKCVKA